METPEDRRSPSPGPLAWFKPITAAASRCLDHKDHRIFSRRSANILEFNIQLPLHRSPTALIRPKEESGGRRDSKVEQWQRGLASLSPVAPVWAEGEVGIKYRKWCSTTRQPSTIFRQLIDPAMHAAQQPKADTDELVCGDGLRSVTQIKHPTTRSHLHMACKEVIEDAVTA